MKRPLLLLWSLLLCLASPAHAYLALVRQGVESADVPNADDLFGYTIAAGDFDGDGHEDVAISSPWEANGLINTAAHGIVTVNWGSSFGLTHTGAALLSPGAPADNSIKFGYALAVGDFDGDGYDDLAVGAPEDDQGAVVDAGSVWIYDGFAGGLQLAPSLVLTQSSVGQTAQTDDNFGFTLTTGDFDGNGYDDLAITAIGENGAIGQVTVVYSVGASGLSTTTAMVLDPMMLGSSAGIAGGWFGKALASGDLDDDGFDDLVIGAPKTDVNGIVDAGRLYVLYGSQVGVSTTQAWKWDTSDDTGWLQDGALELGWSLVVAPLVSSATATPVQIVAGAPGYASAGKIDSGAIVLLAHSLAARAATPPMNLYQQPATPESDVNPQDRFGEVLAAGDFDGDLTDELAVGVPTDDVVEQVGLGAQLNAGSVYLYDGNGNATLSLQGQITHETLNDHVITSDNLGRGLAFAELEGTGRHALVIGAPYGDRASYEGDPTISNTGRAYVHAPWRQPRNRPHRGSAALDCEGYLVYAQRAWQRMRPASTTKTMTLQIGCDFLDQGQDPSQWIPIPGWVANNVGGSQAGHLQGDQVQFRDLFKTMMTVSGNDSAMLLAALMSGEGLASWSGWSTQSPSFAAAMETQAAQWGMSPATSFTNAAGIDSGDHYTTPYDFAIMTDRAIEDPCVKNIVNRSNWIVPTQRIGANGTPGQLGLINLNYVNGFVNGVRNLNASSVGMKGGQTPGALRTGVYNSYVPLAGGHNAAAGFGVWDDDDPIVGAVADCNSCLGAELLAVADIYCQQSAFPDKLLAPEPTPGPWATLTGFSSAAPDTAVGLVFNADGSEANELGRQIQVDVLRANQAFATSDFVATLRHASELCLEADASESVGISPYQQHDGIVVANRGEQPIDLRLEATDPAGYVELVTLAPDSTFTVPATDGSGAAAQFTFTVTNLTLRTTACIEIHELGYRHVVSLGDGVGTPDVRSFHLDRSLLSENDTWSLEFKGLDPLPGNLLDVSAHDPSNTVSVDGGDMPQGPRPATSRLLPNVPNPFNPSTRIRFDLTRSTAVQLRIHDARGRVVRTLSDGATFPQGRHELTWDGRDDAGLEAASGVYYVRLDAGASQDVRRVVMLK